MLKDYFTLCLLKIGLLMLNSLRVNQQQIVKGFSYWIITLKGQSCISIIQEIKHKMEYSLGWKPLLKNH